MIGSVVFAVSGHKQKRRCLFI